VNTFEIDYLAYGKGIFYTDSAKAKGKGAKAKGKPVQSYLNGYATMSYSLTNAVAKNKNAKAVYYSVEDYMPDWINWAP
jgi:hypothetical protein